MCVLMFVGSSSILSFPLLPCSMYWFLADPPQCALCQVHAVVVRTPAATCLPEQAGRWQQQAASKQQPAGRRRRRKDPSKDASMACVLVPPFFER